MQASLEASLVRLRTADGCVVGAGFLVGEQHVLTCAHVVSQALGLVDPPLDLPGGLISLDFPFIPPRTRFTARVVLWCPPLIDNSGDIAGLELQREPPSGARAVRSAPIQDVWEHPFRAFGFPPGQDDGVWATGRLLGRQATNWVMIEDVKEPGFAVAPGFSGTPVWDTQAQAVVGMVVAASRPTETKTAFVIPWDVLVAAWTLITIPLGEPRNPYKGLHPFTQKDAGDFFGREPMVEKLVEIVTSLVTEQARSTNNRLLTIIGPSGSGKSSLIMAGLLPQLQHGTLPGSKTWLYLEPMVPGKHPIESLVLTLAAQLPERSFASIRQDLDDEDARGLHQLCTHLVHLHRREQPEAKIILLVDQLEELFTQTESEDERQRFIKLLLTACSEPRGPLLALLTLRADFYDRPMRYPELFQVIDTQHLSLLWMEMDNLQRVIEQPAALPDVQLTFEGNLVPRLLAEVQGQVGALPLLQFTLDQLFQRRNGRQLTLSAYQALGGVKGALSQHAEHAYTTLPSEQHRKLARMLFLRLIDPGMTEQDTTRRRAALSEFTLDDASQTRLLRETIDTFVTARLLTTNQIAGRTTLEVSHEALIREWKRLTDWLQEAREDIPLQQALSEDVAEWERRGKPKDRLYRGSQLKEVKAWAKRNMPSENEVAFLRASAAHQTYARTGTSALVLVLVLTLGLVVQLARSWPYAPDPTHVTSLSDAGPGSLREAINTAPQGSTITFAPGLHGTIVLTSGNITTTKHLTIHGPGANTLAISSQMGGNYIHLLSTADISISGLAFKDSIIQGYSSFIFSEGTLTLSDCIISGNTTIQGNGGGIHNYLGKLTLKNSIVSDNRAKNGEGGGIENTGTLTVTNSTISDNTAFASGDTSNGEGGSGGGINNSGTLTLTNSTISGNAASIQGGGINNTGINGGLLQLTNSTISGNRTQYGGGISNTGGQIDITFSTIYGNTADHSSAIYSGDAIDPSGKKILSHVVLRNSILAHNRTSAGPDLSGTFTSKGYNLIQSSSDAIPGDLKKDSTTVFMDPHLDVKIDEMLRDNGGQAQPHTKTHALLPGSPAIDRLPLDACHGNNITTDQRGTKRPDGAEQFCDIGAYESEN